MERGDAAFERGHVAASGPPVRTNARAVGRVGRGVATCVVAALAVVPSVVFAPFGVGGSVAIATVLVLASALLVDRALRSGDPRWLRVTLATVGSLGGLLWLQWAAFGALQLAAGVS